MELNVPSPLPSKIITLLEELFATARSAKTIAVEVTRDHRLGKGSHGYWRPDRTERAIALAKQDNYIVRRAVRHSEIGETIAVEVTYNDRIGATSRLNRRPDRKSPIALAQQDAHTI
jgi:hypothetical protein